MNFERNEKNQNLSFKSFTYFAIHFRWSLTIVCNALVPFPRIMERYWFPLFFSSTENLKKWLPLFWTQNFETLRAKFNEVLSLSRHHFLLPLKHGIHNKCPKRMWFLLPYANFWRNACYNVSKIPYIFKISIFKFPAFKKGGDTLC